MVILPDNVKYTGTDEPAKSKLVFDVATTGYRSAAGRRRNITLR